MPTYDYECPNCGPFSQTRPMALAGEPSECPQCGTSAQRAFFHAPHIAGMSAGRRKAFETNERSAHEPKLASGGGHGAGCSCCGGGGKRSSAVCTADGAKSFPSKRPWMISH